MATTTTLILSTRKISLLVRSGCTIRQGKTRLESSIPAKSIVMSEEAKREAMGARHFVSGTRKKVFICNDRREYKNLQGEVNKLEKKKANNMKKYDDEIKDWKEILKQLQSEKEGAERIQSLIEANRETLKSSTTTRRQNAIKSIRRCLAPSQPIRDFPHKPAINHELISKPPSVPRKVRIELLKREQTKLNEEKLSVNETKPRKPENTNAFLDDAVAMYAKLRREITVGPQKREDLSSAQKVKSTSSKKTRPITVPSDNSKGLETKELVGSIKPKGIKRSKTFEGFVQNAQWNNSPQATRRRDKGRFPFKNTETSGLGIVDKGNTENKQPMSNKKGILNKRNGTPKIKENSFYNPTPKPKTNCSEDERKEKSANHGVLKMPKVQFASSPDHAQDAKDLKDELKLLAKDKSKISIRDSGQEMNVPEEGEEEGEMTSLSGTSSEQEIETKEYLASLNNVAPSASTEKRSRSRSLSDSLTLFKTEDNHPMASSSIQRLRSQSLLKTDLPRPRRHSESKTEQNFDESNSSDQRFSPRKHSVTGSPRRHSQPSSISTTRLSEIISEKILEQVTNSKKRLSITSNQKTSILKSYARMLQYQLKMDDVPDSESPDFSETPFMRNKMNQHDAIVKDSTTSDEGFQSRANKTLNHFIFGKSQLQLGSFQSSFDYSEIEEENVLKEKERRRLSVPFFAAAGIATRKERGARLKKLRKEQGEKTISEGNEGEAGKEHKLDYQYLEN